MSMLVILLAPRPRGETEAAAGPLSYVLSPNGVAVGSSGRAEPRALPRADTVVAVLAPADAAWLRLTLPKAPAARLKPALSSVAEEQLLEEPEEVHLALQPGARAGEPVWVAATHRRWLGEQLAALDAAGIAVDRVVPDTVPGVPARGHFVTGAEVGQGRTEDLWISWSDANGALCVRAAGGLARALLPGWLAQEPSWTSSPAAAAPAERWLGAPVQLQSEAEHALAAARSGWNLRQFDLALHPRGWRALRDFGRHALGPAWRPVRFGLAALLVVHLVGLNIWAWQQQRQMDARRIAITELLRQSHPQVRAVLDAPAQMQRETEVLRAAAGRAGDGDFETLLSIAAAAWPDGRPPVEQLRFETGRLTLPAAGWAPEQVQSFRARVEQSGGELSTADGQLVISRMRKGLP